MTTTPEAIAAAAEALNDGLPGGLILDDGNAWRAAKRALEAAAPHITTDLQAQWTRIEPDPDQPGYNRGVFDVSGFAAEVLAPAERGRIRAEAVAAERERIRQLAIENHAMYPALNQVPGIGGQEWGYRPFADLLGPQPVGADAEPGDLYGPGDDDD